MMRKSGLHKKVSSIFGDVTIPGAQNDFADSSPANGTAVSDPPGKSSPVGQNSSPTQPQNSQAGFVDFFEQEEMEHQARQKKMALIMGVLFVVLAAIMYVNFFKPAKGKAGRKSDIETNLSNNPVVSKAEIEWKSPDPVAKNMRDPMLYSEYKINQAVYADSNGSVSSGSKLLSLKAIVLNPNGGSMAMIGSSYCKNGDLVQGWKVVEITKGTVLLEKDGEKLELNMEKSP